MSKQKRTSARLLDKNVDEKKKEKQAKAMPSLEINEINEEEGGSADQISLKKRKKPRLTRKPNVQTSFSSDRERDEQDREIREQLRQEQIENDSINITDCNWDKSGHQKDVEEGKKGDKLAQHLSLEACKTKYQEAIRTLSASYVDHKVDRRSVSTKIKENILPIWLDTWNSLSREVGSGVHPLFQSKEVLAYLGKVAWNVAVLEMRKPGLSLANGHSLLLTGPKGVGKTTLLHGAFRVTKTLCLNVLPIYHDYERGEFDSPKDTVAARLSAGQPDEVERDDSWVRYAFQQGHGIAFFGDEVQYLYVSKASATPDNRRARGEKILRQILAIGKDGNAFGVLSGSSTDTACLGFKKDQNPEFACYPNLNESVYREQRMKPFRNLPDLKAMVKERFLNTCEWDDTAVRRCFVFTGGIGRFIDDLFSSTNSDTNPDNVPLKSNFLELLVNDNTFFHVASILHNNNSADITTNPFSQTSISTSEIRAIFERHGREKEWLRSVEQWIDNSVIYESHAGLYEFLIPAHYEVMSHVLAEQPDRPLVKCLQLLLDGYEQKGSPGGVVEEHVRHLIERNSDELDLPDMVYRSRRLSAAMKTGDDEKILYIQNLRQMDDICGELFSLTVEHGIDGLLISKVADGYEADIFQMKFGERTKIITAGIFPPSRTSKAVTLANIVHKADQGAKKIAQTLSGLLDGTPLVFKSLTLCTSKEVPQKHVEEMKKWTWGLDGGAAEFKLIHKPQMRAWLGNTILDQIGGL